MLNKEIIMQREKWSLCVLQGAGGEECGAGDRDQWGAGERGRVIKPPRTLAPQPEPWNTEWQGDQRHVTQLCLVSPARCDGDLRVVTHA